MCNKLVFSSAKEALKHIREQNSNKYLARKLTASYYCNECQCHHVTSKKQIKYEKN